MKIKRWYLILVIAFLGIMALACDTGNLIALGSTTPTRTPRPTFTPQPTFTSTPEDTATPEPTNTPLVSPTTQRTTTPTARPVVVAKTPTKPAPPPPPQFAWHQRPDMSVQGRCDAGPSVFEIKGRVFDQTVNAYVGGIHVVVLDKTGAIANQIDSWGPESMNPEWGVSCFEPKNSFNYQMDISAARESGPLTVRLSRGKNDPTPISDNVRIDITSGGGRWYIDWVKN